MPRLGPPLAQHFLPFPVATETALRVCARPRPGRAWEHSISADVQEQGRGPGPRGAGPSDARGSSAMESHEAQPSSFSLFTTCSLRADSGEDGREAPCGSRRHLRTSHFGWGNSLEMAPSKLTQGFIKFQQVPNGLSSTKMNILQPLVLALRPGLVSRE